MMPSRDRSADDPAADARQEMEAHSKLAKALFAAGLDHTDVMRLAKAYAKVVSVGPNGPVAIPDPTLAERALVLQRLADERREAKRRANARQAGDKGNRLKAQDASDRRAEWQDEADRLWRLNPYRKKADVAAEIAETCGGGAPGYIERTLRKPRQ